jgi:hypothetical protein
LNLESVNKNKFFIVALSALVICPILIYWQVGLMQYTMKWDMMDQYFPFRYFIGECLQNGILPWWNPHINLGYPFHADPQSAFWYPVTWFFALGGYSIYDLHVEFIFHVILAGLGFYFLLKKEGVDNKTAIIFSCCYQACGFFISNSQHFTYIISAAWIPWVFLCFHNLLSRNKISDILMTALCLNFLLTGGYPALFIITNYLLVFFFIYFFFSEKIYSDKKRILILLRNIFLVYVLFALLSSGYIISFIESREHITRGGAIPLQRALYGPFPPEAMISLFFPLYVILKHQIFHSDISMINGYLGLVGLIFVLPGLLVKSKFRWFWFAAGLCCLLVAFGDALPIREWLYYNVPLMDTFRFPSVFRLFFIMAVLILAAHGFNQFFIHDEKKFKIAASVGLLSLLSFLIVKFINSIIHHKHFEFFRFWNFNDYEQYLSNHTGDDIFLIQSFIQLLLTVGLILVLLVMKSRKKYFLIAALVFADMFLASQLNMNGTVTCDGKVKNINSALTKTPHDFPVYDNTPLNTMHTFEGTFYPSNTNHAIFLKTFSHEGYNPFLLKNYERFEKSPKRYELISNRLFYLNNNSENELKILKTEPNNFQAEVSLQKTDTITLTQVYYPNWSVTVDDKTNNILPSEQGLMQVTLTKGNHHVHFQYKPNKLASLLLLQYILLAGIMIYLLATIFIRK